jgi:hypothetical protein
VRVTAGGRRYLRDVTAGDSYASSHDPRLHFGLGSAVRIDSVEVDWPDGTKSVRKDLAPRQRLIVRHGS